MIGVAFKQAVLTLVERKISYTVLAKLRNKTSDSVIGTIITQLALLTKLIERLTLGSRKEFAEHKRVDASINSTTYLQIPLPVGNGKKRGLQWVTTAIHPQKDLYIRSV